MRDALGRPGRVLLLGGTSEIGLAILRALPLSPDTEAVLAGRDPAALEAAGRTLRCRTRTAHYDATALETHPDFVDDVFATADVDVVISAAGILVEQWALDADPVRAGRLVTTDLTGHVTTLLAVVRRMRAQGHGTVVVLSSVAAVRPRAGTYVYGAAKAGLDAFARGLADSLTGTGVHVLLVRPGFVIGRMTRGLDPAPLATTPEQVGAAVARALVRDRDRAVVWVPPALAVLATAMRLTPAPLWRKIARRLDARRFARGDAVSG